MQITEIDLGLLDPHPENREVKNPECESLAQSIAARGVLDPLTVRPHPVSAGRYEIVSGHRRAVASRMADAETAPCIVRTDISDMEALEMVIVANIERRDLDPEEEARAVRALASAGMTAEDIVDRIHRSRDWVQLRLALGDLPQPMRKAVAERRVALEVAAQVLRVPEAQREEAVTVVLEPTYQELPLTTAQAKEVLEMQFIRPAEERAAWEAGMAKRLAAWKKALAPAAKLAGHPASLVPVAHDAKLPGGDLRNAMEVFTRETLHPMDPAVGSPEGMTFGALAMRAGHPVFIAPASRARWLEGPDSTVGDTPASVALVDADAIMEFERAVANGEVPAVSEPWLTEVFSTMTKEEERVATREQREARAKELRGMVWDYLQEHVDETTPDGNPELLAKMVGFSVIADVTQMAEVMGFSMPEMDDADHGEWMARLLARTDCSWRYYMTMAMLADAMWIQPYMIGEGGDLHPDTAERLKRWLDVLPDTREHLSGVWDVVEASLGGHE